MDFSLSVLIKSLFQSILSSKEYEVRGLMAYENISIEDAKKLVFPEIKRNIRIKLKVSLLYKINPLLYTMKSLKVRKLNRYTSKLMVTDSTSIKA